MIPSRDPTITWLFTCASPLAESANRIGLSKGLHPHAEGQGGASVTKY
jgi:hypothetical protein